MRTCSSRMEEHTRPSSATGRIGRGRRVGRCGLATTDFDFVRSPRRLGHLRRHPRRARSPEIRVIRDIRGPSTIRCNSESLRERAIQRCNELRVDPWLRCRVRCPQRTFSRPCAGDSARHRTALGTTPPHKATARQAAHTRGLR